MSYNDRILAIIMLIIIVITITILWFWGPKVLAQLECVILFSDFEDFCCYNFTSIIHVGTIDCVHLWVYSDPMISSSSVLCVNNQVMATPVIFSQNPHCATKKSFGMGLMKITHYSDIHNMYTPCGMCVSLSAWCTDATQCESWKDMYCTCGTTWTFSCCFFACRDRRNTLPTVVGNPFSITNEYPWI